MGERYDVLVTLADGVFPLVAFAEGKNTATCPGPHRVRRRAQAHRPPAGTGWHHHDHISATAADEARLETRKADRVHRIGLAGGMDTYAWGINGKRFGMKNPTASPLMVNQGERVRLDFVNTTTMCIRGTCTVTPTSSAPAALARTPPSSCRRRRSRWFSTRTTQASGCCTATTPARRNRNDGPGGLPSLMAQRPGPAGACSAGPGPTPGCRDVADPERETSSALRRALSFPETRVGKLHKDAGPPLGLHMPHGVRDRSGRRRRGCADGRTVRRATTRPPPACQPGQARTPAAHLPRR